VSQENLVPVRRRNPFIGIGVLLFCSACVWAQSPGGSSSGNDQALNSAVQELQQQVSELRSAVAEMRAEAAQYRAETAQLRSELQNLRGQPNATEEAKSEQAPGTETAAQPESGSRKASGIDQRVASLEETTQLLSTKVDDEYQTKVESASKYRMRLSGIVLMNLFSNHGQTDNIDIPSFATGPNLGNGTFGATLRQSEIGLEVFGPTVAGAKTSANLQADFAGGFADTWNGVNSGIFRLRIATGRMDWGHTSLVVGQDDLFISPNAPTSFASLAVPAFNYAGNLWAWTPQVRVEHRFDISDNQSITIQGGILDNLSGEFPANSYFRAAGPGEASGQPAYAFRTSWTESVFGRPLTLGAAGYYSRQDWGFDRYSDGWAGMTDWQIPLARKFELSGEFYRGRAVGGIGGGTSLSVLFLGNPALTSTPIRGLDSRGGWGQFKFRANPKLELNAAFGLDNPTASEIRGAAFSGYPGPLLVQNRSALVNFVYRPRSSLLFSTEFRHLQSFQLYGVNNTAEQINMVMGVLF